MPSRPSSPVLGNLSFRVVLLASLALGLASVAGCQSRRTQQLPNRVLDRPLDAALACVRLIDGVPTPQSLDQCSDAVAESVCGDIRLIGFVANSERNDIAMFSRCEGAVIDMDVAAPGSQLISAGEVPSSMTVTTGVQAGCFAVSANLGSCDLSVLDVGGIAAYAFDEPPDEEPGAFVSTVIPRRADRTSCSFPRVAPSTATPRAAPIGRTTSATPSAGTERPSWWPRR